LDCAIEHNLFVYLDLFVGSGGPVGLETAQTIGEGFSVFHQGDQTAEKDEETGRECAIAFLRGFCPRPPCQNSISRYFI
jgi:hypothetical protein